MTSAALTPTPVGEDGDDVDKNDLTPAELAARAVEKLKGPRDVVKIRAVYQRARLEKRKNEDEEPESSQQKPQGKAKLTGMVRNMMNAVSQVNQSQQLVNALTQFKAEARSDRPHLRKGILTVRILSAHKLSDTWDNPPNAYVLLSLGSNTFKTTTCQSTANPEWKGGTRAKRQFSFIIRPEETHRMLNLEVVSDGFDQETDVILGSVDLDVHGLPWDEWKRHRETLVEEDGEPVDGAELVFDIRFGRDKAAMNDAARQHLEGKEAAHRKRKEQRRLAEQSRKDQQRMRDEMDLSSEEEDEKQGTLDPDDLSLESSPSPRPAEEAPTKRLTKALTNATHVHMKRRLDQVREKESRLQGRSGSHKDLGHAVGITNMHLPGMPASGPPLSLRPSVLHNARGGRLHGIGGKGSKQFMPGDLGNLQGVFGMQRRTLGHKNLSERGQRNVTTAQHLSKVSERRQCFQDAFKGHSMAHNPDLLMHVDRIAEICNSLSGKVDRVVQLELEKGHSARVGKKVLKAINGHAGVGGIDVEDGTSSCSSEEEKMQSRPSLPRSRTHTDQSEQSRTSAARARTDTERTDEDDLDRIRSELLGDDPPEDANETEENPAGGRRQSLTSIFQKSAKKIGSVAVIHKAGESLGQDLDAARIEIEKMIKGEHVSAAQELLDLLGSMDASDIHDGISKARSIDLSEGRPEIGGILGALQWRRDCLTSRPDKEPDAALQKQAWKRARQMAFALVRSAERKLGHANTMPGNIGLPRSGSRNMGLPRAATGKFKALAKKAGLVAGAVHKKAPAQALLPIANAASPFQEGEEGSAQRHGRSKKKASLPSLKAPVDEGAQTAEDEMNRDMLRDIHDHMLALHKEEEAEIAHMAADMAEVRAAKHALDSLLREQDMSLQGSSDLISDELVDDVKGIISNFHGAGLHDMVDQLKSVLSLMKVQPAGPQSKWQAAVKGMPHRKHTAPLHAPAPEGEQFHIAVTDHGLAFGGSDGSQQMDPDFSDAGSAYNEDGDLYGKSITEEFSGSLEDWNCHPWELNAVLQRDGWPRALAQPLQKLALARRRHQESHSPQRPRLQRRLLPGPVICSGGFDPNSSLSQPSFASFLPVQMSQMSSQSRPQTTPGSSVHGSLRMLLTSASSALLSRHPSTFSGSQLETHSEFVPLQGMTGWVVPRTPQSGPSGVRCRTAPSATRVLPSMSLLKSGVGNSKSAREREEATLKEMASSAARHITVSKLPLPRELEALFQSEEEDTFAEQPRRPLSASSGSSSNCSSGEELQQKSAIDDLLREEFTGADEGDLDAVSTLLGRAKQIKRSETLYQSKDTASESSRSSDED